MSPRGQRHVTCASPCLATVPHLQRRLEVIQFRPETGRSCQTKESGLKRYREHGCFVCGKNNPIGLHLTFQLDGDTTRSAFVPQPHHQGYDGVVHGGILAAVLDDAMANCLWLRGVAAVTAKLSLRYRAPVPVGASLLVYGRLLEEREKIATAEARMTTAEGELLVEATGTLFKLPDGTGTERVSSSCLPS